MSAEKAMHAGITRRGFVKLAGIGAGAATLGATGTAMTGCATTDTTTATATEELRYTPHLFHCGGNCALECTVRDGKIVKINPRQRDDDRYRKQCIRAVGELSNTYSQDRVKTPLRRIGERGEGKFEQITWDEAISAIAEGFKASQEKYGKDSVFIKKTIEALNSAGFNYMPTFLGCQTEALSGIDRNTANGVVPAMMNTQGLAANSIWEWVDAKTIINLAHNTAEAMMSWNTIFADAQEAGAKIITIDPRFSATAGKSDQWISVIPGQDLALFLGMLNAILENKWYDEEFCTLYTSMPHLIDAETGEMLGEKVTWRAAAYSRDLERRDPLVWDTETQSAMLYSEVAETAALEGEFEVDGRKVVTQMTLLKQQIAKYTPAWAAQQAGVEEQVIIDLADRYANNGNAIINYGMGGPDKFTNADILGHTLAVLTAITGNFGRSGTGLGAYAIGGGSIAGALASWPIPQGFGVAAHPVRFFDMPTTENNVHAAMFFGDVPFLQRGDANQTAAWLKSLDFIAVAEIYLSTVCDYADIVIPSTSRFECAEPWKTLRASTGYLHLQQQVVEPLFEAKDDLEIERLILAHWGYDQYLPKTYEELARYILEHNGGNLAGITFEDLVKANGMVRIPGTEDQTKAGIHTPVVPTHTGKAELYYEDLLSEGLAFPQFEEPSEAYAANPLKEKYPFIFIQGKSRFRMHSYLSSSPWFQQMFEPTLMLNPIDAKEQGFSTGDEVRVCNDRGEFVTTITVDESIRPGVAFMYEEQFSRFYKSGLLQNVTNSAVGPRGYAQLHGAQVPWNDTLIAIEKA